MDQLGGRAKHIYIQNFTGLRGIAIIFVLLFHSFPQRFPGGWLAVLFFFVLSAYLLTDGIFYRLAGEGRMDLVRLLKRRFKRLYGPLVFFLLLLSSILLFVPELLNGYRSEFLSSLFAYNNYYQLSQKFSYFDAYGRVQLFKHLWMLTQEIQLLVFWSVLLRLIYALICRRAAAGNGKTGLIAPLRLRRHLRKTAFSVAAAFFVLSAFAMLIAYRAGASISDLYYRTSLRAFSFCGGAMLACLFRRRALMQVASELNPRFSQALLFFLSLAALAQMIFVRGDGAYAYCGGMVLYTLNVMLLLPLIASARGICAKILCNPFLLYAGSRSYTLYLWHYSLIELFRYFFRFSHIPYILQLLLRVLVLLVLSELTYRLFEGDNALLRQLHKNLKNELRGLSTHGQRRAIVAAATAIFVGFFLIACTAAALIKAGNTGEDYREELRRRIEAGQRQEQERLLRPNERIPSSPTASAPSQDADIKGDTEQSQPADLSAASPSPEGKADDQAEIQESPTASPESTDPPNDVAEVWSDDIYDPDDEYSSLNMSGAERAFAAHTPVYAIGDSVMLCDVDSLRSRLPQITIDAAVSRQIPDGIEIFEEQLKNGNLPKTILFALGTNGIMYKGELEEMISEHPDYQFLLMNTISNKPEVEGKINPIYEELANTYANAYLIDWYGFAKGRSELFYGDATHPNPMGGPVYARFVARKLVDALMQTSS